MLLCCTCTVFSVYDNSFVLCMSANICKYVFVLYCSVFSIYLTLTLQRRISNQKKLGTEVDLLSGVCCTKEKIDFSFHVL